MAHPGRTRAGAAWGLLAACLLAGCGPTSKRLRREIQDTGAGVYLAGVPFVRQRRHWCGPAALASVACYHRREVSQEQIAGEVYLPSIRATLTTDLAACALRHGLWSRAGKGSPDDVRLWLDRGLPVIALLKLGGLGGGRLHYVVVTGYHRARGCFIAHTGHLPNRPIAFDRFAREHAAAGAFTLVACPPERVTWPLTADGHNKLGLLLERGGALARARAEYQRAIAADPARHVFHFNLGNVLARLVEREGAERAYREAIRLCPQFADAHNNLADLLLAMGRRHLAHSEARRAVQIDGPRVAYYYDTLGRALLALERHGGAADAFRSAIRHAGSQPGVANDARLGLIDALVRAGERAQAAQESQRLLASSADPALRQRLDRILR